MDDDYELFLQELDGDKEMRTHVNLYKSKKNISASKAKNLQILKGRHGNEKKSGDEDEEDMEDADADADDEYNEDDEEVKLEELLDSLDLSINDQQNNDENNRDEVILSVEQAAQIPSIPLETAEFDVAQYDPKDYKFL